MGQRSASGSIGSDNRSALVLDHGVVLGRLNRMTMGLVLPSIDSEIIFLTSGMEPRRSTGANDRHDFVQKFVEQQMTGAADCSALRMFVGHPKRSSPGRPLSALYAIVSFWESRRPGSS